MKTPNSRTRRGIQAITAFMLIGLSAFVYSPASGLSQTEILKWNITSASEPVVLTDAQGEYSLGPHMDILEDPGGELTIDQVSSPAYEAQFIPSQTESPNYGFTNSVYWVRLDLDNETHKANEWLLEVNFANMHYVDLYTPLPDGNGFELKQTGILRPVSTRDVIHPQIVFNPYIPALGRQTLYLRFQSGASMVLGLTLWTQNAFLIDSQWQHLWSGLFFGILIGLLAYNLFLLFSLRDVNSLYLVIGLAATIFFVSAYDGYTQIYLIPNLYYLVQYYFPFSFFLLIFSIVLFADSFLKLKTQLPNLHAVNVTILVVWGALVLLIPFASYYFLTSLFTRWALVSLIVVLIDGIASLRKDFRPAWLFLIAWAGLTVSLSITILLRLGYIFDTFLTVNLFRLGFLWQGVCWSLVLADRINLLKAETENTNQELRSSEHRLSQILEGMPLGVVLYGNDHKPRYINRRTEELLSNEALGLRPDLSAGRTLAESIRYYSFRSARRDEEYPLERFPPYTALQGAAAHTDDLEMDQGDRRVPFEIWASPIKDDQGNIESAVVAFQDITQRKQSEAELEEYRRNLEALVGKRTEELNAANQELKLRLEWMSAIVLVTETMARSSDFTQIYEKIIEIINRLFAIQDSFIAELDESREQLKILAHSCHSQSHPDLVGSLTTLPGNTLADAIREPDKLVFLSKEQLDLMNGPIGCHIQVTKIQGIVLAPLLLREQVFGFLGLEMVEQARTISSEESNLLRIFLLDIAHLIEDSRLFEQNKALITAEERHRLARDLHDSVTQTLFTASVLAEAAPRMFDKDQAIARQYMTELNMLIRGALAEMRSILIELRSLEMQNQTLDDLLVTLVEAAQTRTEGTIRLLTVPVSGLPKEVTVALYRIAREALNNAILHAEATEICVFMLEDPGRVEIHVQDNGCGFDPSDLPVDHFGIKIMGERAKGIGGDVQIYSEPGHGTDITITWPDSEGE